MPTPLITPESAITQRILNACEFRKSLWTADSTKRNRADDLIQSGSQVCSLLNDLFWVSMNAEEGRSVVGSVCICSPEEAPRSRSLTTPVKVSPQALVQLFVASPSNHLAIHLEHGVPSVWGFLDACPMFTLRVQVPGVGTLVVSEDKSVIAVFQRGDVLLPRPIDRTDWALLLAKALGEAPFPERAVLAARFQEVAFAMHSQGHGGALVIAPPFEPEGNTADVAIKYRFDPKGSNCVRDAIGELVTAQQRLKEAMAQPPAGGDAPRLTSLLESSVEAHRQLLTKLLRSVGKLSRIDGAVVMDTDLRVHGFGAKLSGNQESFTVAVIDTITESVSELPISSLGGMRHQSAARYVHRNTDSMVVVASQDGGLTLFAWIIDRRQVAAVRGLEHYAWSADGAA
jgi:DNA integrity scanning protein DisA with diadenylate cyclase activity